MILQYALGFFAALLEHLFLNRHPVLGIRRFNHEKQVNAAASILGMAASVAVVVRFLVVNCKRKPMESLENFAPRRWYYFPDLSSPTA